MLHTPKSRHRHKSSLRNARLKLLTPTPTPVPISFYLGNIHKKRSKKKKENIKPDFLRTNKQRNSYEKKDKKQNNYPSLPTRGSSSVPVTLWLKPIFVNIHS